MVEYMLNVANHGLTPWLILAGAALIVSVAAYRSSHDALWGDLFDEDDEGWV